MDTWWRRYKTFYMYFLAFYCAYEMVALLSAPYRLRAIEQRNVLIESHINASANLYVLAAQSAENAVMGSDKRMAIQFGLPNIFAMVGELGPPEQFPPSMPEEPRGILEYVGYGWEYHMLKFQYQVRRNSLVYWRYHLDTLLDKLTRAA